MTKKINTWLLAFTLLISSAMPLQEVAAQTLPSFLGYRYSTPEDFVQWVTDEKSRDPDDSFVKTYKEEQGYILAPKMAGAVLDEVCWGYEDVAINYKFHNDNISWRIFVDPISDWKKQYHYDIGEFDTFVKNINGVSQFNQTEELYYEDIDGKSYTYTECYVKKKLQLGDNSVVDCVQGIYRRKNEKTNNEEEQVRLYFLKSGMYVHMYTDVYFPNAEKYLLAAMENFTFEKYLIPIKYAKLTLNKKKNKISKKNAILCATLNNTTDKKFTYVEFCLYDKKQKKIKIRHRKKVTAKSEQRETVGLKFNVQKVIKDWRKRGTSKRKYPLERKKKYKYMIRTKVGSGYLETVGTFRLK